ncbi:MAG: DinB family protein [Ferruginibacter sp.]
MKKLLLSYAAYNLWANQRILDVILNLTDEQINREIESSFSSIFKTVAHMWDAESLWWQRVKMMEKHERPSDHFTGTITEMADHLIKQSKQWKEWVDLATEAALEHEFIYRNTKKEQFKQPVSEVLHHIFNHATYHRGQLVTMLRQVGVKHIPGTDLVLFLRKK